MRAYAWDEISCEVIEWDVPTNLVEGFTDVRLRARVIDAYIGHQVDPDYPPITVDGEVTRTDGIVSYEGTYGDRGHRCGLYFGPIGGSLDAQARAACARALDEYTREMPDPDQESGDRRSHREELNERPS